MLKFPEAIQQQLVKADRVLKTEPSLSRESTDFIGLLTRLLNRLEKAPVTVELADAKTGQKEKVTVGKWDLQFFTASSITQTWGIRNLPAFYTALSKEDFTPLARAALDFRKGQIGSLMAALMICASAASQGRYRIIKKQARQTLLSDAVNFPFPGVCEAFGNPQMGPAYRTPVKSNLPVLLISGTMDGRTPVSNAEEIRRGFANSKHIIIEGASHGYDLFFFIPAVKEAMEEFLRQSPGQNSR
jgi:pimeloyl-ACP methyl ester carboxylesterase